MGRLRKSDNPLVAVLRAGTSGAQKDVSKSARLWARLRGLGLTRAGKRYATISSAAHDPSQYPWCQGRCQGRGIVGVESQRSGGFTLFWSPGLAPPEGKRLLSCGLSSCGPLSRPSHRNDVSFLVPPFLFQHLCRWLPSQFFLKGLTCRISNGKISKTTYQCWVSEVV